MRFEPMNWDTVMLWSGVGFFLFLWLTPLLKSLLG